MATATVTIPTIQACAATTLETRIAAIKKFFGLPRWVTRNQPAAQSAIQSLPTNPAKFLQPQTVESERERNLIALMEVSKLSKPTPAATKDRILTFMDKFGDSTADKICRGLGAGVARKGVTSRISEMVKAGELIAVGKMRAPRSNGSTTVTIYRVATHLKEGK